ncbi:MAG: hypothetical protein ACXABY_05425 [Candidatus Thorarchaeota archaeon]|jgi:hypothetical protein
MANGYSGNDDEYSAQSRMAIERKQRELDKAEAKAEAAERSLTKLFHKVHENKSLREKLAQDCLEGVQGKKTNPIMERISRGENAKAIFQDDLVFGPEGVTDRNVTGFEDRYWEEGDEDDY